MENSQATKNAFSATSAAIATSLPRTTIGGSQCGGTPSAINGGRKITVMFISRTRTLASETSIDPNLPTRLRYARDEALRSKFAKRESRHFEPANKSAAAPSDLTA